MDKNDIKTGILPALCKWKKTLTKGKSAPRADRGSSALCLFKQLKLCPNNKFKLKKKKSQPFALGASSSFSSWSSLSWTVRVLAFIDSVLGVPGATEEDVGGNLKRSFCHCVTWKCLWMRAHETTGCHAFGSASTGSHMTVSWILFGPFHCSAILDGSWLHIKVRITVATSQLLLERKRNTICKVPTMRFGI